MENKQIRYLANERVPDPQNMRGGLAPIKAAKASTEADTEADTNESESDTKEA